MGLVYVMYEIDISLDTRLFTRAVVFLWSKVDNSADVNCLHYMIKKMTDKPPSYPPHASIHSIFDFYPFYNLLQVTVCR